MNPSSVIAEEGFMICKDFDLWFFYLFTEALERADGTETLVHFECLNKAENDERNGNHHHQVKLYGGRSCQCAEYGDQRAHHSDYKQAE